MADSMGVRARRGRPAGGRNASTSNPTVRVSTSKLGLPSRPYTGNYRPPSGPGRESSFDIETGMVWCVASPNNVRAGNYKSTARVTDERLGESFDVETPLGMIPSRLAPSLETHDAPKRPMRATPSGLVSYKP